MTGASNRSIGSHDFHPGTHARTRTRTHTHTHTPHPHVLVCARARAHAQACTHARTNTHARATDRHEHAHVVCCTDVCVALPHGVLRCHVPLYFSSNSRPIRWPAMLVSRLQAQRAMRARQTPGRAAGQAPYNVACSVACDAKYDTWAACTAAPPRCRSAAPAHMRRDRQHATRRSNHTTCHVAREVGVAPRGWPTVVRIVELEDRIEAREPIALLRLTGMGRIRRSRHCDNTHASNDGLNADAQRP